MFIVRWFDIMIKWGSGLSIGVEKLDTQHKSLLDSLWKLSKAVDDNVLDDVLRSMFDSFEKDMLEHLRYEETLLKECNYLDLPIHIKEHKEFEDIVSKLKEKFFATKEYMQTQEILLKLTNAMVNNIIEDALLTNLYEENGLTDNVKKKNSLHQRLIDKILNRVSFSKRLALLALIPLMGMIILGVVILYNNFSEYQNIRRVSSISLVLLDINEITHNMQMERGLSCAEITSKSNKFRHDLVLQRLKVDSSIETFKIKLSTIGYKNLGTIKRTIKNIEAKIALLQPIRLEVDKKIVSVGNTLKFYSDIIDNIIGISTKIALLNHDKDISSSISTLSSLLYLKESFGLQRAYGTIIINQKDSMSEEYNNFIQLIGSKKSFLDMFHKTSTNSQTEALNKCVTTHYAKELLSYENKIIDREFKKLDAKLWFQTATIHIDNLHKIEQNLLQNINQLINKTEETYFYKLLLWIVYITLFLIIVQVILYLFSKSSKMQVLNLTTAMKDLASGGRSLRLTNYKLKDVIAQLHDAYESTRQELLKGDTLTQLYLARKEIEIKNQQIQNDKLEELASIDPLTDCVNRRKFEELSNLELQRSSRYNKNLSFLMLDIDHFKSVNDTYGHAVGDEVLKHFSTVCLELARDIDVIARIGGEEFVVMLPETDTEGAYIFGERFRQQIDNSSITIDEKTIKYSVSIGISTLEIESDNDIATILQRADSALYEAKKSGRNRCVIYKK